MSSYFDYVGMAGPEKALSPEAIEAIEQGLAVGSQCRIVKRGNLLHVSIRPLAASHVVKLAFPIKVANEKEVCAISLHKISDDGEDSTLAQAPLSADTALYIDHIPLFSLEFKP